MNFIKTKVVQSVNYNLAIIKLNNPSKEDLALAKPFYEKLIEIKETNA